MGDKIEEMLATALAGAADGGPGVELPPEGPAVEVIEIVEEVPQHAGPSTSRRKSFAVGADMRHTHGEPRDVYDIIEHLGDGSMTSCWRGCHKITQVSCAIKDELKDQGEVSLWEEINAMRKLAHPTIVKLVETFENETHLFVVLELCAGGRLFDKLLGPACADGVEKLQGRSCATSIRLKRQMVSSIEYLHRQRICHRACTLDNFLLADNSPLEDATTKLSDLTTAKEFIPGQATMTTKIGAPSYVARELLSRKEIAYTEKVDVWSLGVTFFVILCGSFPFPGETDLEILKKVKSGKLKFEPAEAWAEVPADAMDLMKGMICPKVEDRLSAKAALEHKWFSTVAGVAA